MKQSPWYAGGMQLCTMQERVIAETHWPKLLAPLRGANLPSATHTSHMLVDHPFRRHMMASTFPSYMYYAKKTFTDPFIKKRMQLGSGAREYEGTKGDVLMRMPTNGRKISRQGPGHTSFQAATIKKHELTQKCLGYPLLADLRTCELSSLVCRLLLVAMACCIGLK